MRVLLALALLLWGVADAHHIPEHSLKEPIFWKGRTSQYEMTLNLTAGIPGMTSQLAKVSIRSIVNVKPKSNSEYLLALQDVRISRPEAGTSVDDDEPLSYMTIQSLEKDLQKPIRFSLVDGEIKSYSLGRSESPESQKIKRSILHHFEGKFQDENENDNQEYPFTYTSLKKTIAGPVKSWYVVTVSPYPEFPSDQNVYNVSKTDIYEPVGYPAAHSHHNFAKQGCPEVCDVRHPHQANKYGAGCPLGYEPHQTPLRMYSNGHYNFRKQDERMVLESMSVEEKHIASMYDQDMVITIRAEYQHKESSSKEVEEPRDQEEFKNLELDVLPSQNQERDLTTESRYFSDMYLTKELELKEQAINILSKISDAVIEGQLESTRSQKIGENLILLQKILSFLKTDQLKEIWSKSVHGKSFKAAGEKEKVQRQILMDVLPLVGTRDAVECLKSLISENKLSTWVAKEVLDTLPENILEPNENIIRSLNDIRKLQQVERQPVLRSAAYLAVARTINKACGSDYQSSPECDMCSKEKRESGLLVEKVWPIKDSLESASQTSSLSDLKRDVACPSQLVEEFVTEMAQKLRTTREMGKKVVCIQALANTGRKIVLDHLAPYINASAEEIESWSPGDIDYIQTTALYALHHIVSYYPDELIEYVMPVYLNRTETPRVRIAAFSVLIRCQPSLNILEHLAQDSWQETSNEVGSYVYSTMSTFGNSSQPCMKLLKKRIQLVMSQFKNYDIGVQHAQSIVQTFFDKVRNFGIEKRFTYIPSNESAVPYGIYTALSYNLDSLKDILYQFAINMQGVEPQDVWEILDLAVLGFRVPKDIPSEKERQIFGTAKIVSRMPKAMRLSIYQRIFYCSSYLYLDAESLGKTLEPLMEHLDNVFTPERNVRKGHLIKVYIPSSLHTLSIARAAVFPVEFTTRHPILLSLKAELEDLKLPERINLKIKPSVYYTGYHALHFWTPIHKTAFGVYHEQKYSWSTPLEVGGRWHKHNQTASITVSWPETNKRIFRYHSEAGTYASPTTLRSLPSSSNRQPIATRPTLFRKEQELELPGLPKVYVAVHTEDSTYGYDEIPQTLDQAIALALTHLRNPGWRRKSMNATLLSSSDNESQKPSVWFQASYEISHHTRNKPSQNEFTNMGPMAQNNEPREPNDEDDAIRSNRENVGLSKSESQRIAQRMKQWSHIAHKLSIEADSWPNRVHAQLKMEYNHTYDKQKHTLSAHVAAKGRDLKDDYKACVSHVTEYSYSPSEFTYKKSAYDRQRVDFYNEISVQSDCNEAFQNPLLVTKGSFTHKPHSALFSDNEFEHSLEESWMLPETHEQCIKDMRNGKEQSIACTRAIREEAIYNNYHIQTEWRKEIPPLVRNITEKLNHAVKYAFYNHADINTLAKNKESTIELTAHYINKLTDTPVLDVAVKTPEETVHYKRVDASYIMPVSSIYDVQETALHMVTNNTYPPTCAIMRNYAKTYDHKTFKLPENTCSYVLSTHCVEQKKFAVLAKNLKGSKKEITVYFEEHKVVLHPSQGHAYPVEFNGQRYQTDEKSPILLNEEANIFVHVIPGGPIYNLVLNSGAGLKIIYNGENVKIQVNPLYKGKLCGLCSEFDGEITREYRGMDQCLYVDSQDYAHSAITDSDRCSVPTSPRFPTLCSYGSTSITKNEDEDDLNSPSERRPKLQTIHMQKGENVCFSTQPAYMCPENQKVQQVERLVLDFHCLPKHDTTTRKLISESKKRILRELAVKSVDFSETVSTAKSCSP